MENKCHLTVRAACAVLAILSCAAQASATTSQAAHGATVAPPCRAVQEAIDRALAAGQTTIAIPKAVYRDGRLPGRGAARKDSQRNDPPGQVRQRDDQEPDDRLSGLPAVRRGVDPERRAGRRMGRGDRRRLRRSRGRLAHSGLRQGHGGARESHAHGRREDRADGAEALLGHGRQEPEGKGRRRGGVVVRLRDVWRHAVNRHPGACRLPGGLRELPRRKRDRLLHARFQRLP